MKTIHSTLLAAALIGMTGCQTVPYQGQARNVKKKPQSNGVIAIDTNYRPEDRTKADQYMKENCAPMGVKVLEEGEVVVGQQTTSNNRETERDSTEHKVGNLWGIPLMSGEKGGKDTSSSATTTNLKEWQISYECEKPTTVKK